MRRFALPILLVLPALAGGCVDHLVTMPARAIGLSTDSRAENDRRIGRDIRHADERRRRAIDRQCRYDPRDCSSY
jgi:hypothetical protein